MENSTCLKISLLRFWVAACAEIGFCGSFWCAFYFVSLYSSICHCDGRKTSSATTLNNVPDVSDINLHERTYYCTFHQIWSHLTRFTNFFNPQTQLHVSDFTAAAPPLRPAARRQKTAEPPPAALDAQPPAKVAYLRKSFEALLSESEIKVLAVVGQEGTRTLSSDGALFCHDSFYELWVY